jgi:hypothetical protein
VQLVLRVKPVFRVYKVFKVSRVSKAFKEQLVHKVPQAYRG